MAGLVFMCLKTADVRGEDVWGIMLTWRGRSLVHVHTTRALFFIILKFVNNAHLVDHELAPARVVEELVRYAVTNRDARVFAQEAGSGNVHGRT